MRDDDIERNVLAIYKKCAGRSFFLSCPVPDGLEAYSGLTTPRVSEPSFHGWHALTGRRCAAVGAGLSIGLTSGRGMP